MDYVSAQTPYAWFETSIYHNNNVAGWNRPGPYIW